ncbi:MAG: DUF3617 family protein [Pseudolabrys sp.]|jgi:hypothetical protein
MHRLLALSTATLIATPALALDMPARKAGLWQLKMEFVGRNLPGQTMKQCVDAATDKLMNQAYGGSTNEACSKQDVSKAGDTMTIDSVCKFGPATVTSHAVVSGSFDSAYTVDVESSRDGGPAVPGGGKSHMRIAALWLGACTAGQKPGDIVMPNGMTMNILDMQRAGAPRR